MLQLYKPRRNTISLPFFYTYLVHACMHASFQCQVKVLSSQANHLTVPFKPKKKNKKWQKPLLRGNCPIYSLSFPLSSQIRCNYTTLSLFYNQSECNTFDTLSYGLPRILPRRRRLLALQIFILPSVPQFEIMLKDQTGARQGLLLLLPLPRALNKGSIPHPPEARQQDYNR